jgi:hypothetical protein
MELRDRTLRRMKAVASSHKLELALYPDRGFVRITRIFNFFLIHYAMGDAKQDKTLAR